MDECKCKLKIKRRGQDKACDKTDECEDMEVDDDVIITSSDTVERRTHRGDVRYKLLQFHTNHRPAYFGSWRRSSGLISARNPFRKDPVCPCRVKLEIFSCLSPYIVLCHAFLPFYSDIFCLL